MDGLLPRSPTPGAGVLGSCASSVGRAWRAAPVVWVAAASANAIPCHRGAVGGTGGAVGARVA